MNSSGAGVTGLMRAGLVVVGVTAVSALVACGLASTPLSSASVTASTPVSADAASSRRASVEGAIVVEHFVLGGVDIDLEQQADGRYRACVTAVAGRAAPPDRLCVGPHGGEPGPGRSWGRADRFGPDVLVLDLHAAGDAIVGDGLMERSATVPAVPAVAVAAGILHGYDADVVCVRYRSGAVFSVITIAVSGGAVSGGAVSGGAVSGGAADAPSCPDRAGAIIGPARR